MRTVSRPVSSGFIHVVYRTGAGRVRERFFRSQLGAALLRAEFLRRVEACSVSVRCGRRV
jgi:hypothetical protein